MPCCQKSVHHAAIVPFPNAVKIEARRIPASHVWEKGHRAYCSGGGEDTTKTTIDVTNRESKIVMISKSYSMKRPSRKFLFISQMD
jgi:hypothetical protein